MTANGALGVIDSPMLERLNYNSKRLQRRAEKRLSAMLASEGWGGVY